MTIGMIQASISQTGSGEPASANRGSGVGFALTGLEAVDWEAVSRRLRRYGVALCGREDEAEDLAQQALAALFAKAPHRADHIGYARQTLTRLWLDRQRSLRRRVARWWKLASGAGIGMTVDRSSLEHHEQVEALHRAIDRLPPRQQAVVTMRLVEGLEYEAIADAIGCEVSAVRASLHLARGKLRAALGEKVGE